MIHMAEARQADGQEVGEAGSCLLWRSAAVMQY